MTSDQSDPEINGVISKINLLGNSTETLFSRLYRSLKGRSQTNIRTSDEAEQITKARLLAERNKRLVQIVRKRETEVQRLNGILAALDEGIIMQDMEGRIVLINKSAHNLLGSHKNFWESELGSLFDAYRDVVKVDSEVALLGEPTRLQINNRILGVQLAAVADTDGQRLGTMIVLRDVTRDAIADRLKEHFVTAISHELRTPMTVIKGASEVLAGLPEDQPVNRRLLNTLTRNVDILDRMVVELLDISEMGAETFSVRDDHVDVEPLLWSIVSSMTPEMSKAKIDLSFMMRDTQKLIVNGDSQRLRWAFGHLLQNSIRYTEASGHIVIAAGLDEENSNYIAVDVIDSGVGISEKDLPHIFERFYRGEPRTNSGKLLDPRGLGQGLFVAKTVADAHKGYLSVKSKEGEGSAFTMYLPIAV